MTPARVAAAGAALVSALLLQATVVGPVSVPLPVSLPAVVVAAVALTDGPGTGLAFGFTSGLVADLGTQHPAGILALTWMVLGAGCGLGADPRATVRRDAAVSAVLVTLTALFGGVLLAVLGADGVQLHELLTHAGPALLGDAILALGIVPLVRCLLRSELLRRPAPVLLLGSDR